MQTRYAPIKLKKSEPFSQREKLRSFYFNGSPEARYLWLYAYNFGVGAHYFMGGILIDADTYVMNTDGQPINGLFAAGEVTGGFHGTTRVDGSGTGDAIVFGRISGKAAAASAKN